MAPAVPMLVQLRIVAVVFLVFGGLATYEVMVDLSRNHVNLNFAVLMLPCGIGLLRRSELARKCSRPFAIFWAAFAGIMMLPVILDLDWAPVTTIGISERNGRILLAGFLLLFGGVMLWADWVLRHPSVRALTWARDVDGEALD